MARGQGKGKVFYRQTWARLPPEQHTILHEARDYNFIVDVRKGNVENVRSICKAIKISEKRLSTALAEASQLGHTQMVKLLLDEGANVNTIQTNKKSGALHIASESGYASIVDLLIAHDANILAKDQNGHTPLHCAVSTQDVTEEQKSTITLSLIMAGSICKYPR